MEIWDWWSNNWPGLFNAIGLMGNFFLLALARLKQAEADLKEAETRQTANLRAITDAHRELWKIFLTDKKYKRVRDASAKTSRKRITQAEHIFVNLVIQHLNSVFYAMKHEHVIQVEGIRFDIAQFLALPIPAQVWEKLKTYQNRDFVAFVEGCLNKN